ncbi:MAG: hypothetical protein JWM51_236 [Microbacteriaceae bacterium]|nr:hypothetical protein [Microbacteriaceae bacterium]
MLAGCASVATPGAIEPAATRRSSASTPSPVQTQQGSPEPETVTALRFSGSEVSALDAQGDTLTVVAVDSGPAAVVSFLTAIVGEPAVGDVARECAEAHTLYRPRLTPSTGGTA